jgi:serine/threonine-protein kinase
MPLTTGSSLGPYQIEAPIGSGGMGEVYRARDTRLSRTVAIKVLSPRLTDTPQFRKRFDREARVIASLEHPHICPLYDVGEHQGTSFLVMQYLQGETLADRLRRGPLPVPEAVSHAVQIAGALDLAHRAGVVHRDLKPGNVMLTKTGVKLLDFGLAHVGSGNRVCEAAGEMVTTTALTDTPMRMGTLPYMAPEQLEGQPVDARTDIFAAGAVLYEMVTGRPPFAGNDASLIAAIMNVDPPPLSAARAGISPTLDRIAKRCLAKDPDARWQSAGDLAAELQWVLEQPEAVAPAMAGRTGSGRAWAVAAGLAAVAAAGAWILKPVPTAAPAVRAHLTVELPQGAELSAFTRRVLALSPDGQYLAYGAGVGGKSQLYLRRLDQPESSAIAETDGFPYPTFSPDGQWIAFRSGSTLWKVSVAGGAPVAIVASNANGGIAWGTDDHLVYAPGIRTPLSRVATSAGEPHAVTTLDAARNETSHRFPALLPGGRHVLFMAGPPADGPWYDAEIALQSLDTGERQAVIPGGAQPRYVAPGYLVYSRAGTLYAVPFDARDRRVTGASGAVLEGVRENPAHGAAQFDVSANGTLAYVPGGLETTAVVRVDRRGRATPLMPQERRLFEQPRLSPDGAKLAVLVGGGHDAAFVFDIAGGQLSRVTTGANYLAPIWAPDGLRLATVRIPGGPGGEMVAVPVDRSGPEELLHRDREVQPTPQSWSLDGRVVVFGRGGDIWTLALPDKRAEPFLQSSFLESAPAISPDGRWLAYTSNESGRFEVIVQEFRRGGRRWQVSRSGGAEPVWARDSSELYFRERSALLAVAARPPFSGAVALFDAPWSLRTTGLGRAQYDVAPDGQSFVMIRVSDPAAARIHVVLNWVDELRQKVRR